MNQILSCSYKIISELIQIFDEGTRDKRTFFLRVAVYRELWNL